MVGLKACATMHAVLHCAWYQFLILGVCMLVCTCSRRLLQRPEGDAGSLGAGVTGTCEPLDAVNQSWVLYKGSMHSLVSWLVLGFFSETGVLWAAPAVFRLRDLPASVSSMLGLEVCTTTPREPSF